MSETRYVGPVTCGHCGNTSRMLSVGHYSQVDERSDPERKHIWDSGPLWDMALCPVCDSINLCETPYHSYQEIEDIETHVRFPAPRKPFFGLPAEIDRAYEAAQRVRSIDSNAFAVLLGRVIELVCLDRGAKGKTLNDQMTSLADNGEIPPNLVTVANTLRKIRNIGAHASLGDLQSADIPTVEALCKAILEYVYSAPKLVELAEKELARSYKKPKIKPPASRGKST